MTSEKFIPNKTALVTLIAASLVVIISLGIRQTFGLFFFDFEIDLGCTQTEFGFAMGIQLFFWGLFGPLFGIITDKFSGRVAVFVGFLFYLAGIYFLNYGPNTGFWFTFDLGILIGIGLAATAISIPISIVSMPLLIIVLRISKLVFKSGSPPVVKVINFFPFFSKIFLILSDIII